MNDTQLNPDEIEALLRIGSMDQDQAMLARRLAQVDALRAPMEAHHSGIGGALGAVAQTLNGYNANKREQSAYATADQMKQAQLDAMRTMINARNGQQPDPGSVQPPQMM